jgi:hypothetical protein
MGGAKTFSDLLNPPPLLWPKRGDRLLRSTEDWDKAVTFSSHPFDRGAHIWTGYMRAGAVLVEATVRASVDRHWLVYPILFNYRHGLEVAMKWIIDQYGRNAQLRLNPEDRNHDLLTLWKLCKRVIVDITSEDEDDDGLRSVEQIVLEFHKLDRTAMALRYSRDKRGRTIDLPDTPIDLGNVMLVMESVDNFFRGLDGQLDAICSA